MGWCGRYEHETYACEHMPRIEEEERCYKPQDVGRKEGNNEGEEELVGK